MAKVTINRATTSSTGAVKGVVTIISTLNGVGMVAKITPNHHSIASTNTVEMAARPLPTQPGGDIELTGVASHT